MKEPVEVGRARAIRPERKQHERPAGALPRPRFPFASLPEATLILEGEVAIFDEQLVSRFEWLRHGTRESVSTPPMYMVP